MFGIRDHCGGLYFDFGAVLHKRADHDQGHCGEVTAEHRTIDLANFRKPLQILRLVRHEPSQANEVFSARPGLRQDGNDIPQRLLDLTHEILGFEDLIGIPANLTAEEDSLAFGKHAVGIAPGGLPVSRV